MPKTNTVCKFTLVEKLETNYSYKLKLTPVCPADPGNTEDEDARFWNATPNGLIELTVDNKKSVEHMKPGDDFFVTITSVDVEEGDAIS